MTAKCKFCNDTKQEPGVPGVCVWCDEPKANAVRRYTAVELRFATNSSGDYVSAADYDTLAEKLAEQVKVDPVEFEYPDFHEQGMGCGLEDRGITDRYEAMRYGFEEALDQMASIVESMGPLYTHADAGEVIALRSAYLRAGKREHDLRTELADLRNEVEQLRSALADNAERHVPVESDGWVAVTERKPIRNNLVLVAFDTHAGKNYTTAKLCQDGRAHFDCEAWYVEVSGGNQLRTVTHWREFERAALERKP